MESYENKCLVISVVGFILCAIFLVYAGTSMAYADELQAGQISSDDSTAVIAQPEKTAEEIQREKAIAERQKQLEREAKALQKSKTSAINYINNNTTKYKTSLTKSQKSKLKSLKSNINSANTTTKIDKYKSSAAKVFSKAKVIHKAKNKFIKKTNKLYSKYKGLMNASQRQYIAKVVKAAKKATAKSKLTQLGSKRDLVVYRAKMTKYVSGTEKWSKSHLDYVKSWGKRNNKYLSGTPMSGTGYLIAKAAYDTNMDPRICSAIARVESGCGRAPYGCKYNVWGWVWYPPAMYSWEDGINKWHNYFKSFWGGERYPIQSMHGYGGYGPWYINKEMAKI